MELHLRAYLLWKKSMILMGILLFAVLFTDRHELFLALNGAAAPLGDHFWGIMTNLGDGFTAVLVLAFVIRSRPDMFRSALVGTAVALPFVQGTKFLTTVIRPGFVHPDANIIGHLPGSWSFPSGHSATAALVFGVIFLTADRRSVRIYAFILIILASFSRIAVGVHWPIDAVCGVIVGLSSAAAGVLLTSGSRKCTLKTGAAAVFLTAASIYYLSAYTLNPPFPVIQKIYGTAAVLFGSFAVISILKGELHGRDEKRA